MPSLSIAGQAAATVRLTYSFVSGRGSHTVTRLPRARNHASNSRQSCRLPLRLLVARWLVGLSFVSAAVTPLAA